MNLRTVLSIVLVGVMMGGSVNSLLYGDAGEHSVSPSVYSVEELVSKIQNDPDYEIFSEPSLTPEMKISPALKQKVMSKEKVTLAIITTDVPELAYALSDYSYTGTPIGTNGNGRRNIAVPIIEIASSAVPNIAALPGVIGIMEYERPMPALYDTSALDRMDSGSAGTTPNAGNLSSFERIPAFQHKANEAWEKGFMGDDVNVGILDTGVDFAHPDLYGTQARDNTTWSIVNETVVANAIDLQNNATLWNTNILPGTPTLYLNDSLMSSSSFQLFLNNGTVLFNPPLGYANVVKATYQCLSPSYGWPIVFDPASMPAYVSAVKDNKSFDATWYVNTSDDNPDVTHPIKVDGTYDFWPDELVGIDPLFDGANDELPKVGDRKNDFELKNLYVTQDKENWYLGFDTYSNTSDVVYGVYIDTDQAVNSGAKTDPTGKYVNATGWNGTAIDPAKATHLPEYAIYLRHRGITWDPVPVDGVYAKEGEDKFDIVTIYSWNNTLQTWTDLPLNDTTVINGTFGYSGYAYSAIETEWKGFVEMGIPRKTLGNTSNISVIAFTAGNNNSRAQDSTCFDPSAALRQNDWGANSTTLTAFVTVGFGFFERFYEYPSGAKKRYNVTMQYYVPPAFYKSKPLFGYHPDQNRPLTRVAVCDSVTAGVYDRVYIDLNNNKNFSEEKPCFRGDEISYFDCYNAATDDANYSSYNWGDGVPDISGGMIYFIADGRHSIPYVANYLERYGLVKDANNWTEMAPYIPKNGTVVAMTGEFGKGESHGTLCASSVVGQGKTVIQDQYTGARVDTPQVVGMAPHAKIISVTNTYNGNFFDSWLFAVEGYDGNVKTADDQAQIASNSFGFSGTNSDGWDSMSKFVDWVTNVYAEGRTLFTFSAGNDGNGYGSVHAPSSAPGVICVGATNDFSNRKPAGLEGGANFAYGDVTPFSSNGPSALGYPEPDCVANGRQAFGALPLNEAPVPDGTVSTEIWSGTSLSCPMTAGALALMYQAYKGATHKVRNEVVLHATLNMSSATVMMLGYTPIVPASFKIYRDGTELAATTDYTLDLANGTLALKSNITAGTWINATYSFNNAYPDADNARRLLMSSCDDLRYDVLLQGAGFVNAERAVDAASETKGISTDTPFWVPGDFEGVKYEAFARLMFPGKNDSTTIRVNNHAGVATNVSIQDSIYKKNGTINFQWDVKAGNEQFWGIITNPGRNGAYPHAVYQYNTEEKRLDKIAEGNEALWTSADMAKITISADLGMLDANGDGRIGEGDYTYWLDVYDWTDSNQNFKVDTKDGAYAEMNRMTINTPSANVIDSRVGRPYYRTHSGLAIFIRYAMVGGYDANASNIVWNVTVDLYNKVDWNWLTLNWASGNTLPAGGMDLTATMSVPSDAPVGAYEGGIYIDEKRQAVNEIAASSTITTVNDSYMVSTNTSSSNVSMSDTTLNNVVNYTVADTRIRSKTNSYIIDSTTTPANESLAVTTSKRVNETVVNTTSFQVTGQALGTTGIPKQVIDEYLSDAVGTVSGVTLAHGGSGEDVVEGSLTLYKNGTIWTDSPGSRTNVSLNASYTNGGPLQITDRPLDPGVMIFANGALLTEGVNYTIDLNTGEIQVLSLYVGTAGVPVTATYIYHHQYRFDAKTGVIGFATPSNMWYLTADYQYYEPLDTAALDCLSNTSGKIVPGSLALYKGVVPIPTTDFTVDYEARTVTFTEPFGPNVLVTADYRFYFPEDIAQRLSYGRDIWQDSMDGPTTDPYIWQGIAPTKATMLGFDLWVDSKVFVSTAKIEVLLLNATGYTTNTDPTRFVSRWGVVYETLAKGTIFDNDVKQGWNRIVFPSEVKLNLSQEHSILVRNSPGAEPDYSIGVFNSPAVYLMNCYVSANGSWWGNATYDLAFRTFNGQIGEGLYTVSDNGAIVTDQMQPVVGEEVINVVKHRVYGERVIVTPYKTKWTTKVVHNYIDEGRAVYITDIEVSVDGNPLVKNIGFTTSISDMEILAEVETGELFFPTDYTSNYVSVNYSYYYPKFDLGAKVSVGDPEDNLILPLNMSHGLISSYTIRKNGVAMTEGVNYTINAEKGQMTLKMNVIKKVENRSAHTVTGPTDLVSGYLFPNIYNLTFFAENDGTWRQLVESTDYTLNYGTGDYTLLGTLNVGDIVYAYYNITPSITAGSTIYGPATGTGGLSEVGPFSLGVGNIVNYTFYVQDSISNMYLQQDAVDYVINASSGELTLTPTWAEVTNETVLAGALGGEVGPFALANDDINNCSLYIRDIANRWFYVDPVTYTIDLATGQITLLDALITGDSLYAYYNYSTSLYLPLHAGDSLIGYYNYTTTYENVTVLPWAQVENTFYLDASLKNLTLYVVSVSDGSWREMSFPAEYIVDSGYGIVTLQKGVKVGDTIWAWYNFSASASAAGKLVYGPALGGETGKIGMGNRGIINCTIYSENGGTWTLLTDGSEYSLDPDKGTLEFLGMFNPGDMIYAFYNYTYTQLLNPGDIISADYTYHDKFLFNTTTGNVTFSSPATFDHVINVDYTYFTPFMKDLQLSVGNNASGITGWKWDRCMIIDAVLKKNGTPADPASYYVNPRTGTVHLLSPLGPNNSYSISYSYYQLLTQYPMGATDANWSGGKRSIIDGTPTINLNGSLFNPVNYNIDSTFALIEFLGAYNPLPPNVTITGTFNWYPYYESDYLPHGTGTSSGTYVLPGSQSVVNNTAWALHEMLAVKNESVFGPATGGETGPWQFGNVPIIDTATLYLRNATGTWSVLTNGVNVSVMNASAYGPAVPGDTGYFYLASGDIINCTIYKDDAGSWNKLNEGVDYSLNNTSGNVTLLGTLTGGEMLYSFYNYSIMLGLKTGDRIFAYYNHSDYSLNPITGKVTFRYLLPPNWVVSIDYSFYNETTKFMLPHRNVTNLKIWRDNPAVTNATAFGPALGGETGPFTLGNGTISNCRLYLRNATGEWSVLVQGVDYGIALDSGEFWTNSTPMWAGNFIHAYYNYSLFTDYSRTDDQGFTSITFNPPIWPNELLRAEYSYYNIVKANTIFELPNSYLIGGSWVISNNGTAPLTEGVDFELIPTESVLYANATVKFLHDLPPDWVLSINYSYYLPVTSAVLSVTNTTFDAWQVTVDGVPAIEGMDYTFDPYHGIVYFVNPLHPGQVARLTYTYSLTTTIPVLVNVASNNISFNFGGPNNYTQDLYNNSRANTGFTGSRGGADWRFYYVVVPEQGMFKTNLYSFLVDLRWQSAGFTGYVSFWPPLAAGDNLWAYYNYSTSVNELAISNALGGETTATLNHSPVVNTTLQIEHGGAWTLLVNTTDYSLNSVTGAITLAHPLAAGDKLWAFYNYSTGVNELVLGNAQGWEYLVKVKNAPIVNMTLQIEHGGIWTLLVSNIDYIIYNAVNTPSDIDTYVFGKSAMQSVPNGGGSYPTDRYGPYALSQKGSSMETTAFFTTTGGPREVAALPISSGLNIIGLRTPMLSGKSIGEDIQGSVGVVSISDKDLKIYTNSLTGMDSISMQASIPLNGITGLAAGPSAPSETNETILQDPWETWDPTESFQMWLSKGSFTRTLNVDKSALVFNAHITSEDCPDLDLGVFLDGKDGNPIDGAAQEGEFIAYDADMDADEQVKLVKPAPGTYIIKVLGFDVPGGMGTFKLAITVVQGEGFKVSGMKNDTLPSYSTNGLDISWTLNGDTKEGDLLGALYLGPTDAPMFLLIPVTLRYDKTAPLVAGNVPAPASVVSTVTPTISATFSDSEKGQMDKSSPIMFIDGVDVTRYSKISVPLSKQNDIDGYWNGVVTYESSMPLSEGAHTIRATARDLAGNEAVAEWTFTVDTVWPSLSVTEPPGDVTYTSQNVYTLRGNVEAGTDFQVYLGASKLLTDVQQNGDFTARIDLSPGFNEIRCTATDAAGHVAGVTRTINLDQEEALISDLAIEGGTVTNADATVLVGKLNKAGSLAVNGLDVPVMSDRTFRSRQTLREGVNAFELVFTDAAGNAARAWRNVTRDTAPPAISINPVGPKVDSQTLNVSGISEPGAVVSINGKHVSTRADGGFAMDVALSYGPNVVVIESKDRAGNVAEQRITTSYEPSRGVNYAAIGLMMALLVIGLIVGIALAMAMRPKPTPEAALAEVEAEQAVPAEGVPAEEAPPAEGVPQEPSPPGEEPKPEEPPVAEEIAPKEEAAVPFEKGDKPTEPQRASAGKRFGMGGDTAPEPPTGKGAAPAPAEPAEAPLPVKDHGDKPPIPKDEAIPKAEPKPAAPAGKQTQQASFGEKTAGPAKPAPQPIPAAPAKPTAPAPAAKPAQPATPPGQMGSEEKIARLKKAFEEGKISKELYEANVKKLKG